MLWPFVLPAQITFWSIVTLLVISLIAASAFKWSRRRTLLAGVMFAMVGFIPSCTLIMDLLDSNRFGVFEYASFGDVKDFRVERFLPTTAKGITLEKYPQGFRARFKITEAELLGYLDSAWAKYGADAIDKRETKPAAVAHLEFHQFNFGELGWPFLKDAVEYQGPTARNGAGFFIWYSPSAGIAHERASYW
jgi:hypothetical protein